MKAEWTRRMKGKEDCILLLFFFNFLMFIYLRERERERERQSVNGVGQRERETQNLKQVPGSELSAQSPMWGSNSPTTRS